MKGRCFYIHVLGEVLAYEVDQIATVLPSDTSLLQIEEDKDLCDAGNLYALWGEHPPAAGAGTSGAVCAGDGGRKWKNSEGCVFVDAALSHGLGHRPWCVGCGWRGLLLCKEATPWVKKAALLAPALAVAGLCILLWPVVSGHRLQADMSAAAQGFLEEARQPYSEVLTDLQEYNERIYAERQAGLADAAACEEPAVLLRDCGVEDEIIGVLEIPTLELVMPVYLGASVRRTFGRRGGGAGEHFGAHWRRKYQLRYCRA